MDWDWRTHKKKPTKEETINFIELTLNTSHNMNGSPNDNALFYKVFDELFIDQKVNYQGIYFEKIKSVKIDSVNHNNNTSIKINFDNNR